MTAKLVLYLGFALSSVLTMWATDEPTSQPLNVHLADGTVEHYTAIPAKTVKLLFPEGEAVLDDESAPRNWNFLPQRLLKGIKLLKLTDTRKRFVITGAAYGNKLFTFDELFCDENPHVMSQLMQLTGTTPQNPDEALGLSRLYLALSNYGLRNPAEFVVSSVDEIPKDSNVMDEKISDIRQVLHAPHIASVPSGYQIELFAKDLDMPRIHRWKMTISRNGVERVSDQRVYPNHEEMQKLYSQIEQNEVAPSEAKIQLSRCCFMADGRAQDGASTDLGMLAASNGPFVSRTHYYYRSDEKAEKLMQRFLTDAIVVTEDDAWLDAEGKAAGRHAIAIIASPDKKLSAVQLFEQGSGVLEYSSSCLRNVLAVRVSPPPGHGASDSLVAKLDCPDRANSVAFSPDGKQLAVGYGWRNEGGLKVWDTVNRNVLHSWVSTTKVDSQEMIRRVAFSPNGKLLAAATWDGDLFLFHSDTWGEPTKVALQAGSPTALSFSPSSDQLAFSTDKTVIVYDLKSAKVKKIKAQASLPQNFIEAGFFDGGKTLVICDYTSLEFWDIGAERIRDSRANPNGRFNFFCNVSPAGHYLVSGGGAVYGKKLVEVWHLGDSKPPAEISAFRAGLFASAMSHSENLVAFGGGDYGSGGDIVLWKTGDDRETGHVLAGKFPIQSLAFSVDDTLLAAASHDGAVFLYSVDRIRAVQATPSPIQ